ncbi:MAG: Rrf2 family transcriptional regulator [Bacteroidetes bacterium]|nr:MAG: Rrf2 family transcriptional regulator [Bacteroidota bacterium]
MSNSLFNMSEAASIGIHSMVFIAKNKNRVNVNKLAEEFNFSKHHVAKVMQRLNKFGMLDSSRGPSGGFFLKMEPKDISLLDIYEAIEGKLPKMNCPMGYDHCPFKKCLLGTIVNDMSEQFKIYLEEKSLQYYLDNNF